MLQTSSNHQSTRKTPRTLQQKLDIWRFSSQLPDYYDDLASLLASTTDLRQLDIFLQDAQRYQGTPRGRLSEIWAQAYGTNGADLASTWQGYMPDDDVAILRVQQDLGNAAIVTALRDLSRMSKIAKELRDTAMSSVGVGLIAVVLAVAAGTVLPVWATGMLEASFGIPPEKWGQTGQRMAAWASFIESSGSLLAVFGALAAWWLWWSPSHWTGPARRWADKHILLYRAQHEIYSMRSALTLATITRPSSTATMTLRQSLEILLASARSPWSQAQIERILSKIASSGAADYTVFESGLFTDQMYWRLQDVSQSQPIDKALAIVAETIPRIWLPRLKSRMTAWRWALMLSSMGVVITSVAALQATVAEMQSALMNSIGA